jgi:hypothetical protein
VICYLKFFDNLNLQLRTTSRQNKLDLDLRNDPVLPEFVKETEEHFLGIDCIMETVLPCFGHI